VKIAFLGTNGWYDTETGNTPCVLIETTGQYIILDAGFGFYKTREYIRSEKPVLLFISHLHLDHLIGLHTLPIFKIPQGIDLYIPKIMERDLRSLLRMPFTSPPWLLPTRLRFHDALRKKHPAVVFETAKLRHSVACYGYRFTIDGASITYCTDTGACGSLERLAKDADLLITECAMSPGEKKPNLFHITPETAAGVAKKAGAKKLALCHFDPGRYPTLGFRKEAERAAKKIFENTIAANDGTVINL